MAARELSMPLAKWEWQSRTRLAGQHSPHHFWKEQRMLKARKGFTLIELLIVIVIIGILAAIAIPKFSATREKAYFKAMMSDLRNLQSQQELWYSNPSNDYTYADNIEDLRDLGFQESAGVEVEVLEATTTGWSALATHLALGEERQCGVFVGDADPPIDGIGMVAGVVACGEDDAARGA
jgi:type IV pilus assembly protein PilA